VRVESSILTTPTSSSLRFLCYNWRN